MCVKCVPVRLYCKMKKNPTTAGTHLDHEDPPRLPTSVDYLFVDLVQRSRREILGTPQENILYYNKCLCCIIEIH